VIEQLRSARERFAELHRQASIALGNVAELAGKAGQLLKLDLNVSAAATSGNLYYSEHRKTILELAACPHPAKVSSTGFTDVGWNWSIQIIPIRGTENNDGIR
jgi:hypothetical protein